MNKEKATNSTKKERVSIPVNTVVRTLFILAGTDTQARNYAKSKDVKPNEYIYLHDRHQLYGRRGGKVIRIGSWYQKNNGYDMCILAEDRDFKVIDDKTY